MPIQVAGVWRTVGMQRNVEGVQGVQGEVDVALKNRLLDQ